MAVGRDVMGADGLTNAQRYAKRQADARARQAASKAASDARKAAAAKEAAAASMSSPSSMFGGLVGTTQQVRNPPPPPPAATTQDTLGFGHQQTTATPPPPAVNGGMLTPLEQLAADGNTKAQQQEQAADDFYGMSNAQREALQGYYDSGIIDPETNLISEEFLLNPENNDALYQMFIGGFGLGRNDLHSSLISQAQAGFAAQGQAANPYDADANAGLTFGGGSNAGDYVETPPTYVDPPAPPPSQVDPDTRGQEEQDARNTAFMDFLSSLGLSSLVDLFNGVNVSSGGLAGSNAAESTYTPYTPEDYTPSQVDYNSMLTTANEVGYDPYRGLYNVPDAMKSTADQLGLFSYIYPPQVTPMAPYDPMANITVPTIDYTQLNSTGG